jgi:hypothetical protein
VTGIGRARGLAVHGLDRNAGGRKAGDKNSSSEEDREDRYARPHSQRRMSRRGFIYDLSNQM